MTEEPIRIHFSRYSSTVIYLILLVICTWAVGTVIRSDSEGWLKAVLIPIPLLFIGIAFWGLYLLSKGSSLFQQKTVVAAPESKLQIIITDDEVTCHYIDSDKTEKIRWDEIDLIQVMTTDKGPAVCDVFLILQNSAAQKGVVLPQDRPETGHIVDIILKWPRFDHRTFTIAMGSSDNNTFQVWKK